jgi:hypothetical protein
MEPERHPLTLLTPKDFPILVREGGWIWMPHTSVWNAVSPDGYILFPPFNKNAVNYPLDLIAVNGRDFWEDENGTEKFAAQLLTETAWSENSIAVLHHQHYGAATLLVPASVFTYDLLFEAIARFTRWLGMNDNEVFSCSAQANLPYQR